MNFWNFNSDNEILKLIKEGTVLGLILLQGRVGPAGLETWRERAQAPVTAHGERCSCQRRTQGLGAARAVDQEPRGLRECARQDGVDGGLPRWPSVGEALKRLGVVGLDSGEVLATADGESAYTPQPVERGREVRDTSCRKKKMEGPRNGSSHLERRGSGAPAEFNEGLQLRCMGMVRRGRGE
jgi:hypothetical protein